MAVNVYAGQIQPIMLALTIGPRKIPIDAFPLTRAKIEIFDRDTMTSLGVVDSSVDVDVFYWQRTQQTVKGVLVYLLELELQDEGFPIQEDLVARLTLYDGNNPLGISWKQFALNSR